MATWFNADGLYVENGRDRRRQRNQPKQVNTLGHIVEVKFPFDLSVHTTGTTFTTDRNNDGTLDGFNAGDEFIPDQAHILSAEVFMFDTAAASGTAITVGTFQENGTAIDADGLVTAANAATASLVANARVAGSGALLNTGVTQKSYIGLVASGTFTAGKGYVLIRYAYGGAV